MKLFDLLKLKNPTEFLSVRDEIGNSLSNFFLGITIILSIITLIVNYFGLRVQTSHQHTEPKL